MCFRAAPSLPRRRKLPPPPDPCAPPCLTCVLPPLSCRLPVPTGGAGPSHSLSQPPEALLPVPQEADAGVGSGAPGGKCPGVSFWCFSLWLERTVQDGPLFPWPRGPMGGSEGGRPALGRGCSLCLAVSKSRPRTSRDLKMQIPGEPRATGSERKIRHLYFQRGAGDAVIRFGDRCSGAVSGAQCGLRVRGEGAFEPCARSEGRGLVSVLKQLVYLLPCSPCPALPARRHCAVGPWGQGRGSAVGLRGTRGAHTGVSNGTAAHDKGEFRTAWDRRLNERCGFWGPGVRGTGASWQQKCPAASRRPVPEPQERSLGFQQGQQLLRRPEREGVARTSEQKMGLGRGSAGRGVCPHEGRGEPAGVVPAGGVI